MSLPQAPRRTGDYMKVCGVDVHKSFLQVAVVDAEGRVIFREKCEYTPSEVARLIAELLAFRCRLVAMESSGVLWIQLFYRLAAEGFRVILVNPFSTRAYHMKTDLLDAVRIARNTLAGAVIRSYVPARRSVLVLRGMVRLRRRLREDANRILNRIHRLLVCSGVWLDRLVKPRSSRWLRALRRLAEGASLVDLFGADALLRVFCVRLEPEERAMLAELLDVYDRLTASCRRLEEESVRLARELYGELYELVQTVPGVGRLLAACILAEAGDVSRFPSARHFRSYCGLAPRVRESAGRARLGRCSRGNPYLRWAFYQAAVAAIRCDDELRSFYMRLRSRGKPHRVALVAVAGKIAARTWRVLYMREPYRAR